MSQRQNNIILEGRGITKQFPGVKALKNVDFNLLEGEIHSLVGENGAGKSTLINIFMGVYEQNTGEILFDEEKVNFTRPKDALEKGISVIEQEPSILKDMTVAENMFLGREPQRQKFFIDFEALNEKARRSLEPLGLELDPSTEMGNLSVSEVQLVEIAKAISYDSKVVIMDEPTSALGDEEVERLFSAMERLKEQNRSIIYVSHKLEEVFSISDRVTVLRDGKKVETREVEKLSKPELVELMISRQWEGQFKKFNNPEEENLLRVENFAKKGKYSDINFSLHKGEILGIFGLTGCGKTDIFEGIFGLHNPDSGSLQLKDRELNNEGPIEALNNGFAYVTRDRAGTGLVLKRSVKENMSLPSLRNLSRNLFIQSGEEEQQIEEQVDRFDIKTPSLQQKVRNLSGGNQQKVVLGKWLMTKPKILMLDDPTRGIDVGTKRELYKFMSRFASGNKGVLLISSEMPELLGMCDRILVMSDNQIITGFSQEEATKEKLSKAASGSYSKDENRGVKVES